MKLLVIDNLHAGLRDGAIYDFIRAFTCPEDEVCIRAVDDNSDFEKLLQDAEYFDLVVASGGDGTVTSICYILRNSNVTVLPFPSGTANLLSLNLMEPAEPHALAKIARQGQKMNFDLGEIEFAGQRHGFALMAGCGYDAAIMQDAKTTKKFLGPLAYLQAAFANPTPQKSEFIITIDGSTHTYSGVGVLIANFSNIQFDISVAGKNQPRDGMLDIIVLATNTALDLIPSALAAAMDQGKSSIAASNALQVLHGREVIVEAHPSMQIQYDGEVVNAQTPFKARALPGAINLMITKEAAAVFNEG